MRIDMIKVLMMGALITWLLALAGFGVCFLFKYFKAHQQRNDVGAKSLPPGSMGLPFLGETLQYLTPFKSNNMGPFLQKRFSRYGDVFKTHIFGRPTIITASAETNQFVFQNEGRLFKSAYPAAFVNILGNNNIVQIHGPMHKKLRQLALTLVGHENLKAKLLQQVENQVIQTLNTWEDGTVIQLKHETAKITFNMLMKQFISLDSETDESKKLLKNYSDFMAGLFCLHIRLPGTTYTKCLKGREKVLRALKNMISERRKEKKSLEKDFLDIVLGEAEKAEDMFGDEVILDFLFGFLFAGYDTTSIAMAMAVKFLTEKPKALQELREEHEAIVHKKIKKGEPNLIWEDYKSMKFTRNIIKEALRLSNIGPFLHRECIQDTEIKGYRIPKGWKVIACTTAVNLDPLVYPQPSSFNPWRWQNVEGKESYFQAFGGGARYCVGSELAKLEMGVLLHHLVTKFRWQRKHGSKEDIVRCPVVLFGDGYAISVKRRVQCGKA